MYDCSKEVKGYHDDEVTLPPKEQTAMRDRRNSNRERVTKGLAKNEDPAPREFVPQGSYAMKTMTQHPENDYDIDDGIYFDRADLTGRNGAEKTGLQARTMVRDALQDQKFKRPPEVRLNCVRIYYEAGYHVDMPVYRRVTKTDAAGNDTLYCELASSDWRRSDARDVTNWLEDRRADQGGENGRQMRRVVREIKKFARSRDSWAGSIASGFCITKLVTECFVANTSREDAALHDTMKAIRNRLDGNLEVDHPVTPNEKITKGPDDSKTRFLRDKLGDAISKLEILFDPNCSREQALEAWNWVFHTDYFTTGQSDGKQSVAVCAPAIISSGMLKEFAKAPESPVRKHGGDRYA